MFFSHLTSRKSKSAAILSKGTSKMKFIITFCFAFFLITATLSFGTRPGPDAEKSSKNLREDKAGGYDRGFGGFVQPGYGFNIPGFGNGGGYGAGYGGPNGGYTRAGIIRPTVVCKEKGPCYKKKLTCPAKCFHSYSRSGKGYGGGSGGGGCTVDCKKKCTAYC